MNSLPIQGAYDTMHWETVVLELTPDKGVLTRGTVLSMAGTGKLDATTAGNEAQSFGVLLDPSVDTAAAAAFSNGSVTGSVARAGSFKGQALKVGIGTNTTTMLDALRKNGIFVEGPVSVPVAATLEAEAAPIEA
jgi:hypothetical protein